MADDHADETLIEVAVAGDRLALGELLLEHAPRLTRQIAARLPAKYRPLLAVEDILQEVFYEASLNVARLRTSHARSRYSRRRRFASMTQSTMPRTVLRATALVAVFTAATGTSAEDPKDILFYGNSFTIAVESGSTRSVPNVLRGVAVAAGHPAPRNRNAAVNAQNLLWHLQNNTDVINTGIAAGEKWDDVVLQDFSTEPTHIGNLARHRSSAVALYEKVAMHSPDVVPILFETWARGPGFPYYTGANPEFPGGPAQMQQEVRDGYRLSTQDINAAIGANLARYAPVGDAWELAGFPLKFYADDIYHAQNRGTLLNALVLYQTIYDDPTTSDIPLSNLLAVLGISAEDGAQLTSLADATRVPEPESLVIAGIAMLAFAVRSNRFSHGGWR